MILGIDIRVHDIPHPLKDPLQNGACLQEIVHRILEIGIGRTSSLPKLSLLSFTESTESKLGPRGDSFFESISFLILLRVVIVFLLFLRQVVTLFILLEVLPAWLSTICSSLVEIVASRLSIRSPSFWMLSSVACDLVIVVNRFLPRIVQL